MPKRLMNKGTKRVNLRMPQDLIDDLKSRVKGTSIPLDHYINALLMVQVVGMINTAREEERHWNQHQLRREARPPFAYAGIPHLDKRDTRDFPPKP